MGDFTVSEGQGYPLEVTIDLGLSLGLALGRLLFLVRVRSSWGLNLPHNALMAMPFSYTKLHLPTLLGTYSGLSR